MGLLTETVPVLRHAAEVATLVEAKQYQASFVQLQFCTACYAWCRPVVTGHRVCAHLAVAPDGMDGLHGFIILDAHVVLHIQQGQGSEGQPCLNVPRGTADC